MKKRHRQMAGKGLKDVTSLNRCSACGEIKRAHLLCPNCVSKIKSMFRKEERDVKKAAEAAEAEKAEAAKVLAKSQEKEFTEEKPVEGIETPAVDRPIGV